MVSKRDRIVRAVEYLKSLGIVVNIAKNKARGNKGFFKVKNSAYRIDLAKTLSEEETLSVLVHEFAHYLHYLYDKTLKSLSFIFDDMTDDVLEELLTLTVYSIPKKDAENLFNIKTSLENEIKEYEKELFQEVSNIKRTSVILSLERSLKSKPLKYFLKYDKVKIIENFSYKIYSIDNIDKDFLNLDCNTKNYLKLKSKQRALKRVNSKINRLNKYYNSNAELFARSLEYFILNPDTMKKSAPNVYKKYEEIVGLSKFPILNNFIKTIE